MTRPELHITETIDKSVKKWVANLEDFKERMEELYARYQSMDQ